jgi:hypothetical protein
VSEREPLIILKTDARSVVLELGHAPAYVYFEAEPGRRAAANLSPETGRGASAQKSRSRRTY